MAKGMQKIKLIGIMATVCAMSISANAAQPGLYLGGQMGWGNVTDSGLSSGEMSATIGNALGHGNFTLSSFHGQHSESGFAWRVFGGYQIGYNWALEIGWSEFPRLPVDAYANGFDNFAGQPYFAQTSGTMKVSAFDFVGKYIYPFACHMNVYGKLGLAYVDGHFNYSVTVQEPALEATAPDDTITDRVYPTAGIGVSYDFRPDISMDLSYSRIQKVGDSEQLGSMNLVLLAMALHFG